jgi:hypothetical protein
MHMGMRRQIMERCVLEELGTGYQQRLDECNNKTKQKNHRVLAGRANKIGKVLRVGDGNKRNGHGCWPHHPESPVENIY